MKASVVIGYSLATLDVLLAGLGLMGGNLVIALGFFSLAVLVGTMARQESKR